MRRNHPFRGGSIQSRCYQQNSNGGFADWKSKMNNDKSGFKKTMCERLEAFIASGESELRLEPMSLEERRTTHIIARKLDLRSVSRGKDHDRYMIIKRSAACGRVFSCLSMNETQSLFLRTEQLNMIRQFISEFPVEQQQIDEHFALPNKKKSKHSDHFVPGCSQRIIPPPPSTSREIERFRRALPTSHLRNEILSTIDAHKVTLITGGTGCGKTTQVPQFILEEAQNLGTPLRVMCTQPRRLPAIAVSKRVAVERGERLGSTVGYHIRLEQRTSTETALTYCTSGVLLRMLTVDELATDMTHIILDEVHEREQNTDYLLIVLKQALRKRDDLKVILMSATMEGNMHTFLNYFDSISVGRVNIPSRLYNVDKFDLADVLALTGYMPRSIFGGIFNASSSWSQDDQQYTYDTFPQVGEFRSEEKIFKPSSVHDQNNVYDNNYNQRSARNYKKTDSRMMFVFPNVSSSSSAMFGQYENYSNNGNNHFVNGNGGFHDGNRKHDVFTESAGFPDFGNSGFGHYSYQSTPQHFNRALSDLPQYFDVKAMSHLRKADFNRKALISEYLNSGGQQWADGVDVNLTVELIRYLANGKIDGAILVFLPGFEDIVQVRDQILKILPEFNEKVVLFTLHSQINSQEQQRVFDKLPHGNRKIILSTNIAEASLTINDVVFVIDSGKVKEKTYDHTTRITQLKVQWIARSNAEQRAGRAGRCRNGFCFRLYSKASYDAMLETQIPEMKRSAIHDVCLHAKMFAPNFMSVKTFLQMAPEPPPPLAVDHSMQFLEQLGALYTDKERIHQCQQKFDENATHSAFPQKSFAVGRDTSAQEFFGLSMAAAEYAKNNSNHGGNESYCVDPLEPELTELGRAIGHLPLEPQLARLLLFGVALKCFNPILTLVASLSHRDPFVLPIGDERGAAMNARDEFGRRDFSDHLMLIRAFYAYAAHSHRSFQFCRQKFLSLQAMKMIQGIRKQLILELKRLRFLPATVVGPEDPDLNIYSSCWPMVQGAIVAGCYPGIGFVKAGSKLRKIRTSGDVNASLHPSSVLKRQVLNKRSETMKCYSNHFGDPIVEYLAYQELSKIDEGLTMRMVTAVSPLSILFFAGPIRMSKESMENFEIAEEDIPTEVLKNPNTSADEKVSLTAKATDERSHCSNSLIDDGWGCDTDKVRSWDGENAKTFWRNGCVGGENGVAENSNDYWKNAKLIGTSESTHMANLGENNDGKEVTSTSIIVEHVGDFPPTFSTTRKQNNEQEQQQKQEQQGQGSSKMTTGENLFKKKKNVDTWADENGKHEDRVDLDNVEEKIAWLGKSNTNFQKNGSPSISQSSSAFGAYEECSSAISTKFENYEDNEKGGQEESSVNRTTEEVKEEEAVKKDLDDIDAWKGNYGDSAAAIALDVPEPEYVFELESWLAFKGSFETMQALARLRFKLMAYLLSVLRNPSRESSVGDLKMLKCLSEILLMDHSSKSFAPCEDLNNQQQPQDSVLFFDRRPFRRDEDEEDFVGPV